MTEGVEAKLTNLQTFSTAEQLDIMVAVTARAYEEGVLQPLPETDQEAGADAVNNAFIAARLRTVRMRLVLLGYLPDDDDRDEPPWIDPPVRAAIKSFQEEAGLTVDGWVGPETWGALQELVSFETSTDLPRWLVKKTPLPALVRATCLRLAIFGLASPPTSDPAKNLRPVNKGLLRFATAATALKFGSAELEPKLTPETLAALFDQDALIRMLAELPADHLKDLESRHRIPAQRFMAHVGKAELWLHGYEIAFDYRKPAEGLDEAGNIVLPPNDWNYRESQSRQEYNLYLALYHFWLDCGHSPVKATEYACAGFGNAFFKQLWSMIKAGAPFVAETATNEVDLFDRATTAADERKTLWQRVWKCIQKLGSRIWDGLQRARNWLSALADKVAARLDWANNLGRMAYHSALRAYEEIRSPVAALAEGVNAFLKRIVPGSELPAYLIERDKDLDYRLIVRDPGESSRLREIAAGLLHQARCFTLAVRIVVILARAALDLVKLSLPGGGWLSYILSLMRTGQQVRSLAQEIGQLKSVLQPA